MKKILFVCHGNICRSVMAEMVMRYLVAEAGREDEFMIDSCATSREEIGNDIYPPAKRCLTAHQVPFSRHAARQITKEDYDKFDLILCMEEYNIRNLRHTLGAALLDADAHKAEPKIRRLLDRDVADPWYTGDFEATYRDVVEGCQQLLG
ncbi:MAG: low molecular weight phosphotyrosine protein phosphatase [Paludibacteraceae bacterium]|nr:low molecular weight phosphotyrosine protein phosphatase [Paludibacteraceae bacterium]